MSVWAVLAGFLTMAVIVMGSTFALVKLFLPSAGEAMRSGRMPPLTTGYIAGNLTMGLVAALAGGMVTTRLAPSNPIGHLVALAIVILVMGLVSARSPGASQQPAWYRVTIPFVGLAGVLLVALLA